LQLTRKKQASEPSSAFKFALFARGKAQDMALEISGTQLHGRVAEISGRTEPGAVLTERPGPWQTSHRTVTSATLRKRWNL